MYENWVSLSFDVGTPIQRFPSLTLHIVTHLTQSYETVTPVALARIVLLIKRRNTICWFIRYTAIDAFDPIRFLVCPSEIKLILIKLI